MPSKKYVIEELEKLDKDSLIYIILDQVESMHESIERLEKALDKACTQIAWLWNDYQCDQGSWDIKEWKEWALSEYD